MSIRPEWLSAIASLALAFVAVAAIFREYFVGLILKPRIRFQPVIMGQPDCHMVPMRWQTGEAEAHYFRIRIWNDGSVAAREVEVAVTEIRKQNATGEFQAIPLATPWNLLWTHKHYSYLPNLSPHTERHLTLGHILDPQDRHHIPGEDNPALELESGQTLFCLETFVRSNTLEYLLAPGTYQIDLEAAATNARPVGTTVTLNHTGQWFPDEAQMYSEGIEITI